MYPCNVSFHFYITVICIHALAHHHISVSNFTLSLCFHVTGSHFHYSPPCQSVRPAMAWLWWESTVLYLKTSKFCLHTKQYSCRGGVIDSKGELVCVYASTTWPSAVLPFSCYLFALWPSPEPIHLFGRAANASFLSITLYLTLSWLKCSERSPLSPVRHIWYEHYCYSKLFGHILSFFFIFHSHISFCCLKFLSFRKMKY